MTEYSDSVADGPAWYDCHWSICVMFDDDIEACDALAMADCRCSTARCRSSMRVYSTDNCDHMEDIIPFNSFASDNSWNLSSRGGSGRRDVASGDNMYSTGAHQRHSFEDCTVCSQLAWVRDGRQDDKKPRSSWFMPPLLCPISPRFPR